MSRRFFLNLRLMPPFFVIDLAAVHRTAKKPSSSWRSAWLQGHDGQRSQGNCSQIDLSDERCAIAWCSLE